MIEMDETPQITALLDKYFPSFHIERGRLEESRKAWRLVQERYKKVMDESIGEALTGLERGSHEWKLVIALAYWFCPKPSLPLQRLSGLTAHGVVKVASEAIVVRVCSVCGISLPTSRQPTYCNDLCPKCQAERSRAWWEEDEKKQTALQLRLQELKSMPYVDYLQTPEWEATRQAALKRVKFRCQLCNQTGLLNVHHRTYERRGEEYARDVIVLCQPCHAKFHDKLRDSHEIE